MPKPGFVNEAACEIRSIHDGTTARFHVIEINSKYFVDSGSDSTILAIHEKAIRQAIIDAIQNGISCCSNGEGGAK